MESAITSSDPSCWLAVVDKYYADNAPLRHILLTHSRSVADFALDVARRHPEFCLDLRHEPYIRHGLLGAELLRREGLPRHARVAERHTGTGLTAEAIVAQQLPLPVRDYLPETLEEQIICYADKFFSKTHLERTRTPEQVLRSLEKFGDESVQRMKAWLERFAD